MFPPDAPSNPNLKGESIVYYLLSKLEDDFYIFQDRYWIFKNKEGCRSEKETDFLLVHPQKGLLIIEVKGGSNFSYDGIHDQWKSGNFSYQNPYIKQLANSKKLPVFLKEKIPGLKNKWLNCGYAICFPHIDTLTGELAPFMEREVTLLKNDLQNLKEKINKTYEHYSTPRDWPIGEDIVEEIKKLITPQTEFKKSLSSELDEDRNMMIKLTQEQQEVLDGFYRVNKPILIEGPAGTGKTQLAISQAISDIKLEKFVLFITNSQESKHYVNQEILNNVNVDSSQLQILIANEINMVQNILEGINKQEEIKIIVDESQQIEGNSLRRLSDYTQTSSKISIIMFKDDSQKTNENNIQEIFNPFPYTLQKIIRNTTEIFESYKDYISPNYKFKEPFRHFKEVIQCSFITDENIIKILIETIFNLVDNNKILPKNITILFSSNPSKEIIKSIALDLNKHNLPFSEFSLANPIHPRKITWSTVYNFQGLENHIILLVELQAEPISETLRLRRLRYIGRSRACSILYIFLKQDDFSQNGNIADIF